MREKLRRDVDAHVSSVRASKISELVSTYEVHVRHCSFMLDKLFRVFDLNVCVGPNRTMLEIL